MIGDQQGARYRMRQVGLDLDTERVEQGDRPARLEAQAGRFAADREKQKSGEQASQDQQAQTEKTITADQQVGFLQTVYPR